MENLIELEVDNGTVRKTRASCWRKNFPLGGAMEIVAHEKTAAQPRSFAKLGGLARQSDSSGDSTP